MHLMNFLSYILKVAICLKDFVTSVRLILVLPIMQDTEEQHYIDIIHIYTIHVCCNILYSTLFPINCTASY